MKKKLLKRKLAAFAALMCLMSAIPLTAWAQSHMETRITVVEKKAKVTQYSTVYVGEVVLNGQQSFYYLYSGDLTNSATVFSAVRNSLSDFKEGIYSALIQSIVGETEDKGVMFCSNSDYTSMMNADWKNAAQAGQACLSNTTVISSSSENLYETDADFAAKCAFEEGVESIVDEAGKDVTICGPLGKLSATNTDEVTYTVENGVLIKHIYRHIDYTCEMVTVIYTRVELASAVDVKQKVTITDAGYATLYYSDKNLEVPSGIKAYTVRVDGDAAVVSKEYGVIPAGTAVILQGAVGEYEFTVVAEAGEADEANMLYGTDENAPTVAPTGGSYRFYKLADGKSHGLGFYYAAEDGAAFQNEAHKAYLAVEASMAANAYTILPTGIAHVYADGESEDAVYTLTGVRVSGNGLPAGIYIVNGKKIMVK